MNHHHESTKPVSALCSVLELSRSELLTHDPNRPEHQAAVRRIQRLLPIVAMVGAAIGSGGTVLVMRMLGAG